MDPMEAIAKDFGGDNPPVPGVPGAPAPAKKPAWFKLIEPTKKTPDDFNGSLISSGANRTLGLLHGHDGSVAEHAQVGQSAELCLDAFGGSGPGFLKSPAFYLGRSLVRYVKQLKEAQ